MYEPRTVKYGTGTSCRQVDTVAGISASQRSGIRGGRLRRPCRGKGWWL